MSEKKRMIYRNPAPNRAELWRGKWRGEWMWNCCIGQYDEFNYCELGEAKTFEQAYSDLYQHLKDKHSV